MGRHRRPRVPRSLRARVARQRRKRPRSFEPPHVPCCTWADRERDPFMPPTEINRDARGVRRTGCRWTGFEIAALDYPAGLSLAPHDHARPNVTLVLRGSLVEEAVRTTHEAGALSVVVKPAGLVHANRFGPSGARTLSIAFDEGLAPEPRWGYRWQQGGREAALVLQMYREWRLGDEAAGTAIESLVLELAALAPPDTV